MLPVIIALTSLCVLSLKIMSETPTITKPSVTKPIPSHLKPWRRDRRNATDRSPVKLKMDFDRRVLLSLLAPLHNDSSSKHLKGGCSSEIQTDVHDGSSLINSRYT